MPIINFFNLKPRAPERPAIRQLLFSIAEVALW